MGITGREFHRSRSKMATVTEYNEVCQFCQKLSPCNQSLSLSFSLSTIRDLEFSSSLIHPLLSIFVLLNLNHYQHFSIFFALFFFFFFFSLSLSLKFQNSNKISFHLKTTKIFRYFSLSSSSSSSSFSLSLSLS